MDIFLDPQAWLSILTLTLLEIVLGIDNIIFISIVTDELPEKDQPRVRNIGLIMAMGFRIGLLLIINVILGLTATLFTIMEVEISGKDLILLGGGLFLMGKSVIEIHEKIRGHKEAKAKKKKVSVGSILAQIVVLDLIFSFDSILTAVGIAYKQEVILMIIAVIISIIVMMIFAGAISRFIHKYPTMQVLALAFLILIGFMLMLEGLGEEINKGYIYFAVLFSLIVEVVNINIRKKRAVEKDIVD
jgi:predicted tellurium resistance membrane protein TerC|tara:strand:+ start:244 stop:978 length:735 start_codon:yes stop_codon:yes gene_type:complete